MLASCPRNCWVFFYGICGWRSWDFPFYDFCELKITPMSVRTNSMEAGWHGGSWASVWLLADSIFHGNEEALYCNSHNSLDLSYLNGTVTNGGSVCSVHSVNSLSCSQSFIQASPVSSNLSIPGSDIMRADYIPSHRHSAIIVPSYRPTPDYETVFSIFWW